MRQTIEVHSPLAHRVTAHIGDRQVQLTRDGDDWRGEIDGQPGERYWLSVDGGEPLVDPHAADVVFEGGRPWSVLRDGWPHGLPLGRRIEQPVVYELHVKGFGGTFAGVVEHLDHVAGLGVDVVELMPVHPFDVTDNYWGYMPVVWGAVHRPYAASADAAGELCTLVAAAHERGLAVWLDVVFNHTGEGDATMPTWTLEGLDRANAYRLRPDGEYVDDSGCGNDINPANPAVRRLVLEALDRFADLGVDGFRFDLASLLARDGGELVAQITEWGLGRSVELIAEAWDLGAYLVGDPVWPPVWRQWNDKFRDDVRGFVRGDLGKVAPVALRVQGSPDVFDGAVARSINFVTAHDGLTMYDLTLGEDEDARGQLLRNYFTILLLSAGAAMFVMGDEFARTQHGDPNPYDVDGPKTWVDWGRAAEWGELTEFVRRVIGVRRAWRPDEFRFHGTAAAPDLGWNSQSLAWRSGNLYVMANGWSEPLEFGVHEPGDWELVLATAAAEHAGAAVVVPARSVAVLRFP